jgi:uncharacterized protein
MRTELVEKLNHYLKTDNFFNAVYGYTHRRFDTAPELTAHNWEHAYRDIINALIIGEAEDADMSIVLPAAAMHDIGFLYGGVGKTHGAVGADKLAEYLAAGDIAVDPDKLAHLAACIRTHKGSMHDEMPETLEAKVVADADLLEKFGPIGVYQTIRTYGERCHSAEATFTRLAKMGNLVFSTPAGQKLAASRDGYVEKFAAELKQAYEPYFSEDLEEQS